MSEVLTEEQRKHLDIARETDAEIVGDRFTAAELDRRRLLVIVDQLAEPKPRVVLLRVLETKKRKAS